MNVRRVQRCVIRFKPVMLVCNPQSVLVQSEQGETMTKKGTREMTKDEALKLALEALEADELDMVDDGSGNMVFRKEQAITAIKEALAQTQELVAWEQFYPDIGKPQIAFNAEVIGYVAPQRTWVGLTYEEKHAIRYSHMTSAEFIEVIEAKLKDKNTSGQE